jgi:hypothetical protein
MEIEAKKLRIWSGLDIGIWLDFAYRWRRRKEGCKSETVSLNNCSLELHCTHPSFFNLIKSNSEGKFNHSSNFSTLYDHRSIKSSSIACPSKIMSFAHLGSSTLRVSAINFQFDVHILLINLMLCFECFHLSDFASESLSLPNFKG